MRMICYQSTFSDMDRLKAYTPGKSQSPARLHLIFKGAWRKQTDTIQKRARVSQAALFAKSHRSKDIE